MPHPMSDLSASEFKYRWLELLMLVEMWKSTGASSRMDLWESRNDAHGRGWLRKVPKLERYAGLLGGRCRHFSFSFRVGRINDNVELKELKELKELHSCRIEELRS
jgi:hypothetical protein